MADEARELAGHAVFVCGADGPTLNREADAVDLLGALWGVEVEWLALPVARLGTDFLVLRTGLAGSVIQKFVTYRLRVAIVGDITAEIAGSQALADFVRESNAGDRVWFVPDLAVLEERLARL